VAGKRTDTLNGYQSCTVASTVCRRLRLTFEDLEPSPIVELLPHVAMAERCGEQGVRPDTRPRAPDGALAWPDGWWDLLKTVLADQILWRIATSAWQIAVIAVGVAASEG
jgi:hypothetical protein